MPVRRFPHRHALLLGLGLLAGCEQAASTAGAAAGSAAGSAASGAVAGAVGGPAGQVAGGAAGAAASAGASQLARMSAAAAQGAWDSVAREPVAACTGTADKPCAEAQELRARACRRQAATAPADQRAAYRDCAVQSGQAALAAAGANTQAERNAWREELLAAIYDRLSVQPRASICPDNDLMRSEADTLLRDSPGNATARLHGASARMVGVSVSCGRPSSAAPISARPRACSTRPDPTRVGGKRPKVCGRCSAWWSAAREHSAAALAPTRAPRPSSGHVPFRPAHSRWRRS